MITIEYDYQTTFIQINTFFLVRKFNENVGLAETGIDQPPRETMAPSFLFFICDGSPNTIRVY